MNKYQRFKIIHMGIKENYSLMHWNMDENIFFYFNISFMSYYVYL